MGLDGIELIMNIEKSLEIEISDEDASNLTTIQLLIDYIDSKYSYKTKQKDIQQQIQNQISKELNKRNIETTNLSDDLSIKDFLNCYSLETEWLDLEKSLNLNLPKLNILDTNPEKRRNSKLFRQLMYQPERAVTSASISEFTDWVISLNFETLVGHKNISNKYELERFLISIISDKTGIEIPDIEPKHSFVDDLGLS